MRADSVSLERYSISFPLVPDAPKRRSRTHVALKLVNPVPPIISLYFNNSENVAVLVSLAWISIFVHNDVGTFSCGAPSLNGDLDIKMLFSVSMTVNERFFKILADLLFGFGSMNGFPSRKVG